LTGANDESQPNPPQQASLRSSLARIKPGSPTRWSILSCRAVISFHVPPTLINSHESGQGCDPVSSGPEVAHMASMLGDFGEMSGSSAIPEAIKASHRWATTA
ncbi:hypothetical protein AB4305_31785, partial [Nocardia sp. 2YAB30]|uniref:hypothetical protein n=1 Tax=Nocardia sp. 2YAB30 TaxID=3233022 RepID=UPI003F9578C4